MAWPNLRRLRVSSRLALIVVSFALPLASGSLTSISRFGLMAFPLAWAGAAWLEEGGERRLRLWAWVGIALLAVLTLEMLWYSP